MANMAKLTKEERAELEARLAEDDDDDDDGRDHEVGFGDGSYVKGAYKFVSEAAAARGFKLRPDPAPEPDAKKSAGKGGNVTQGRFTSGRRIS
jgi:hypothetical protein